MLSRIRAAPDNLETLFGLQELLLSEICLAEEHVRENKKQARRKPGNAGEEHTRRAQAYRESIYFWKMFGDAIAFSYLDRFALKHVYYNVQNLNAKQDAGFIGSSLGLEEELTVVRAIIEAGCPCMLTDLTNTIRYGDVCVLIGPDPMLIEVKSSGTKNSRLRRQKEKLRKLEQFYRTDKLNGLRGFPEVRRVKTHSRVVSFEEQLNDCISSAYKDDYAVVTPEEGVHYIVMRNRESLSAAFGEIKGEALWVFVLNEVKAHQKWAPYYPFTLLIKSEQALYDFIVGQLYIVVLIDPAVIRKELVQKGYLPEIRPESNYAIIARKDSENDYEKGIVGIAEHLMLRAAFETVSLKWIIHNCIKKLEEWDGKEGWVPDHDLVEDLGINIDVW